MINDISPDSCQELYSLHNKLYPDTPEWNTAYQVNRQNVLKRVRSAYNRVLSIENVYEMTDVEKFQLWVLNNHFTGYKTAGPNCPSCRKRMLKKLKQFDNSI